MNLRFVKLEKSEVTEEQISQILALEGEDGYTKEQIECIWQDENFTNDNFVCMLNNKIIANISFNPNSKRRNGSVFMVNLSVAEKYRRMGIAQKLIYTACKYYKQKQINIPMSTSLDKDNIKALNLYKKVGYEVKDSICKADEDDQQYIMEGSLENILKNCEKILKENIKEK